MNTVDRRHFCSFIALSGIAATPEALLGQSDDARRAASTTGAGTLGPARVIALDKMQERKTATGESWNIANGTLATGESVNLHQSLQVAGAPPVQLHAIQHSEFILVRDGEVEFQHEAGGQVVTERAGPGGVLYIPFGTRHAVRNVGSVPARYFVVAIGGDAK
jgi:mannose-6-phosphate isomerase-like protein (cupin superfamily)